MSVTTIFQRRQVQNARHRAAASLAAHDAVLADATERLLDRLEDITRPLPRLLDLSARHGLVRRLIGTRGGVQEIVECELSPALLQNRTGHRVVADEEFLPFAAASFDVAVSVLGLHMVNDLPGTLAQLRRILKPEGVLLVMLPGGATLQELRESFAHAETALYGGIHPRVAPFIDVRDGGALLQRAGFALPVADSETLTVMYPNFFALAKELRATGETNTLLQRKKSFDTRALFAATTAHYASHYALPDGTIPATLELVTLTGWTS
jgi:NADH dehydrogenase [ubiquinone] 1 alpha subcomplex assembly factor 5